MVDPKRLQDRQERIKALHKRLEEDDVFYFRKCLKIIGKTGGDPIPLELNRAQLYAHNLIEEQRRRTGKVRAIIIKGRQQGFSTWIAARFFKKTIKDPNKRTFIVSHMDKTTAELFDKVDFYHDNLPASLKPKKVEDNKSMMAFDNGSRYQVGTAGSGEVGRGTTNQFLHLSEAAFYLFPDKIAAGVMNSVSDEEGTEIILESTVNGIGNWFHNFTMQALEGKNDYIVIFVPWFWQKEYRAPVEEGFTLSDEEEALKELYGLDDEQLQWRRNKKSTYKEEETFRREYPNSLEEAFMASSESLYKQAKIQAAALHDIKVAETVPIVTGIDASGTGGNNTVFFRRQGYKVLDYDIYPGVMDGMRLAGMIINRIEDQSLERYADMHFLDNAYGYDCINRLRELGYGDFVQGVYFSETDSMRYPETYLNKRAEMYGLSRDWFNEYVSIPNDNRFMAGLLMMPNFIPTSNGKLKLPPKQEIKDKLGLSRDDTTMDTNDSFVLTFAAPVYESKRNTTVSPYGLHLPNGAHNGHQKIAKAGQPMLKSKQRMKRG